MSLNSEDLYLNRAKFVMKFLGVWVPPHNENFIRKFYRYFMIILQYLFLIFQIIFIFQVWGDLEAVSQASYLLFTQACLCFKVTVFHVNMDLLKELLLQMNGETFTAKSVEHENILEAQAARIKKLLLAFMISSQLTCGMWALKPLFDDVGSRKFPFDMWMPVSPEHSPHYHIGYAFQLLTICMSAYMYFGVDSVALSSVIFGCAQIEIIKDKLMSIQPVDKYASGAIHAFADNYEQLVHCIKHHQAIVRFTNIVENAYHTFLLFQLIGSVGIICMSALRILVVDPRSMQFFSIVSYLSVMISQLFVSCWCGHELTATLMLQLQSIISNLSLFVRLNIRRQNTKLLHISTLYSERSSVWRSSEDLHTVLYMCAWKEQNTKFQKELYFAMLRMSRPLVLRAGHYIALSRQTFVTILRMSYSYFAVLNQTVE